MFHCFGLGFGRWGSLGWIGPVLNLVLTVAVIVGVVLLVVWLARQAALGRQTAGLQTSATLEPKEALKLRYARGEITREQYLQMLEDLSH